MLKIQDISVEYNYGEPVLENFDLEIAPGEIVALVGESGSGKTTVIRSIMGLLPGNGRVTQGDIIFKEKSLLSQTQEEWLALRGSEISMIFQDSGTTINPIRKIGSQFAEYILKHENISKKEAYAKAQDMLERMRLPDVKNIMAGYPFQLSGGMRQRVGIAMAMTFRPSLLLADEPTSALDVTTQAQIVRQMLELRQEYNTAIIVVTHNLGVAAYMADKILVMKNGRVVDKGKREDILHHPQSPYTNKLLAAVPMLEGDIYV